MGESAGRRGHRWRQLREEIRLQRDPCWICGQAINYQAQYPAGDSFTVDHVLPWSTHPELREDRANLRACCAACNKLKGKGTAPITLGQFSEEW